MHVTYGRFDNAGTRPYHSLSQILYGILEICLLIKTTKDTDKIEDVIEVSKDNIADMIEAAKEADADTLMRHIRVLSELSNDMKTSTQKRVKQRLHL